MRAFTTIAILMLAIASEASLAQTSATPIAPPETPKALDPQSLPLLESTGFPAATEKARATKRLLLVFWSFEGPADPGWMFDRCSRSMSLRAYIKWHAIATHERVLPPALARDVCALLRQQAQTTPAVLVMRDGGIERVVGTDCPPALGMERDPCPLCGPVATRPPSQAVRFVPHPLRVLFQTDFALERIQARDPVWFEAHNLANPEPKAPPEPEPACNVQDEYAPRVWDPRPEEKIGVLDRLDEARRLLKSGDLYQATGLYSWLWERGEAFDPAFRPARLSALAQDLAALTGKRPGAMDRFAKIRNVRTERMAWAEYGQSHDWFVLNGVTKRPGETVEYLDYFVNDLDESSMLPPADAMAYRMLAQREDYTRAWERPPTTSPVQRIASIVQRLKPRFPAQVTEQARADWDVFVKQYLLDEGCRMYGACLVAGDEPAAAQIAEMILKARDDAKARLSLVVTALSADPPQARPIHMDWLVQAERLDGTARPDLRNRVLLRTNPAPAGSTAPQK